MADTVFSVSQISNYIENKLLLDPMLTSVSVRGEVTNYSLSSRGQAYFSIKDDLAQINCIIFDQAILTDAFENGAMVIVKGEIGYYKKAGRINLIVKEIAIEGEGDLYAQFLKIKEKLDSEGLFDSAYKKPLQPFPTAIGVITSAAGAAMHDIVNVATRRFDGLTIRVYPAAVQGADAAKELIQGLNYFNEKKDVDIIIIGRGGGSFEDLFAFNDEGLARAVFASEIPVVSAVGHEVDFSICDFAADFRAPTPSAAAELCVPLKADILANIMYVRERMGNVLEQKIAAAKHGLSEMRLSLSKASPDEQLASFKQRLSLLKQRLMNQIDASYSGLYHQLTEQREKLAALSPGRVLNRGFAFISDNGGKAVRSAQVLNVDDAFNATFADGRITAKVTETGKEESK